MTFSTNFKNLLDLFKHFKDDNTCRTYLEELRWNGDISCPHCGCVGAYKLGDNKTYKCKDNICRKKFTVTVGTIFENTKLPLNLWFGAIYLATAHKKGISSLQLSRDLGITQKTAWFMLHRIREMLRDKAPQMLDTIVEVDETFIGGKNKNRHYDKKVENSQGRSVKDKTPVFGIMQRWGNITTRVVNDTKASSLKPVIADMVKEGTIVVSDEWTAYNGLHGTYKHVVINHNNGEYVRGAFHTNTIEGFWSLFKRGIFGIYHQVSPKHLNRYCDEFTYRYNTRKVLDNERFMLSLRNMNTRLTYTMLVNPKQNATLKEE